MLSTRLLHLLVFSLVVCYQVLLVYSVSEDNVCRPFTKSSGLAELCGYNSTAKFFGSDNEDLASYLRNLDHNCSKHIRLLQCSASYPRCVEGLQGPLLPCRRVLQDILLKCLEPLKDSHTFFYYKWESLLLPEKNDPKSKNFKKRCFEPPNFKTDVKEDDLGPNQCFPLVIPECENYGYKYTILPEKHQQELARWIRNDYPPLGNSSCDKLTTKWACVGRIAPPCDRFKGSSFVGSICRETCHDYHRKNCSHPLVSIPKDRCDFYPKGSSTGLCKNTEWYGVLAWPGALKVSGTSYPLEASIVITSVGLMILFTLI